MSFLPPYTPKKIVRIILEGPNKHVYTNNDVKELIRFFYIMCENKKEDLKITDITLDDLSEFSNFPDGVREEIFNDIKMYYSVGGSEFAIFLRQSIQITSGKSANKR